jgi:hypothetical protein
MNYKDIRKLERTETLNADEMRVFDAIDLHIDDKIEYATEEIEQGIAELGQKVDALVESVPAVENGKDGADGAPGATGAEGRPGRDGANGLPGLDGADGKDGVDGKDGKDGVDGKDGSPDTPEQVVEKVNSATTLIQKDRVEGLADIERIARENNFNPGFGVSKTEVAAISKRVSVLEATPAGSGTPATTVVSETSAGQSPVVGVSTNYAREDHSHGTPAGGAGTPASTVASETSYGITPAVGVGTDYARADHTHGTMATPTKTTVGLDQVDNTSDANKPVSSATQTALNLKLDANVAITGATKTKITYDADGLVTSGADATTADIADSLNKRYVTDANLTTIGNQSGTNTGDNATNTQYSGLAASKQDTLVSATNIKTINGSSVLGAGDLTVTGSQPSIPLTLIAPADDQTITAGYSAYVSDYYEIASTFMLEVGSGSVFEIG